MIVILYDDQREAYIPVYWILMTGKTEVCYDQAFQMLNTDLGGNSIHLWLVSILRRPSSIWLKSTGQMLSLLGASSTSNKPSGSI
mmetsp:Transcript_15170/g.19347  ORF Transcript_15170/g.19347 Transcript_15170/m.19347 type:complete len:85 (+) Transcript_15170:126-380(+)